MTRLTILANRNAAGQLFRYAYGLSPGGRRRQWVKEYDAAAVQTALYTWDYDHLDRLTGEHIKVPDAFNSSVRNLLCIEMKT